MCFDEAKRSIAHAGGFVLQHMGRPSEDCVLAGEVASLASFTASAKDDVFACHHLCF